MNQAQINFLKSMTPDLYQLVAEPSWPSLESLHIAENVPTNVIDKVNIMIKEWELAQEKTKNFCSLIFFGNEYRITRPHYGLRCQPNKDINKVQQEFLKGNKPAGCSACWKSEDAGIESFRQSGNRTLDHLLDKDVINLRQSCVEQKNETYFYKIETGNLCNATCVTCGSKFSSAWASLERKNGKTPFPQRRVLVSDTGMRFDKKTFDTDMFFNIDYKKARYINFLGGETTLEASNFKILEYLIDAGNTDCNISFTTHGNFNLSKEQEYVIKQFPNMQFNFSIDGVDKTYQYLRYPLSWSKCLDNIQYCKKQQIEVNVAVVSSNLNLLYFDQLTDWLDDHHLRYHVNFANTHQFDQKYALYGNTVLSTRVKSALLDRNPSPFVKHILNKHTALDDKLYELFLQDIVEKDNWKGIRLENYLPEFAAILEKDLDKYRV
jgi:sulfatase maturation enzyme AslB (radical SAM superfamily)